ncbi:MAG: hypothetical protein LKE98_04530 [Lachnospiraceae bacterium]|jgi:hypothetical protein|nr:hypothetical protein [Lachnospiraceae bacterium]
MRQPVRSTVLQFERSASADRSNEYLAEAKSADAVLPNAAAGASAPMLRFDYFIIVVSPI